MVILTSAHPEMAKSIAALANIFVAQKILGNRCMAKQGIKLQMMNGIVTAVICMMLLFTACSGIAVAQGDEFKNKDSPNGISEIVDVWYFTNRNKIADNGATASYGGMRGAPRVGVLRFDFKPYRGLKRLSNALPFHIPDERITLQDTSEIPETRFWRQIKRFSKDDQGNIIFFVHGYNIGFEKGGRRAAIFQRALNRHNRLILFSWPADGDFLKYTYDEADLEWSVPLLADVLLNMLRHIGHDKVSVVAHSLGARGVIMALVRIACSQPEFPMVKELVLIAPDIDRDVFKDAWPDLQRFASKTTLYVSENDRAMKLSREVHGYPRLGEGGEHLTILPGIETIDVSLTAIRRPSGHLYHLYNAEVVSDLTTLLNTGLPAYKRQNLIPSAPKGVTYWQLAPGSQ